VNIGDNPYLQVRQQNTPEERFVYLYAIHNYYLENHKSRSLDHGFLGHFPERLYFQGMIGPNVILEMICDSNLVCRSDVCVVLCEMF
jgi:hypothetical protein